MSSSFDIGWVPTPSADVAVPDSLASLHHQRLKSASSRRQVQEPRRCCPADTGAARGNVRRGIRGTARCARCGTLLLYSARAARSLFESACSNRHSLSRRFQAPCPAGKKVSPSPSGDTSNRLTWAVTFSAVRRPAGPPDAAQRRRVTACSNLGL
jgi:hypothetical protein